MKKDLMCGFLWTEETKSVGSGEAAEIIDYDVFNASEVSQFRGVLDDIAKEMGGRSQKVDITVDLKALSDSQLKRLSDGEDIISVLTHPNN
jgi:hypothetical protein